MNLRVLLFVCALCAPLSAQNVVLVEGVELIREGRFDQAPPKLEKAHRLAPHNPTIEICSLLRPLFRSRESVVC